MATTREVRERVQALQSRILEISGEAMLEHKEEITGILVNQQQEEHLSGSGAELKPYTRRYQLLKEHLGKSGEPDYDLTGAMQAEMDLTIDGVMYEFNSPSTTPNGLLKTDKLKKRDGEKSFELTEENKKLIYPIIQETFTDKVNSEIVLD